MTRIIAGRAGSLTLDVPEAGTRPTSDRVRESLFGSLDSAELLQGAHVLDLYAGSGALALEALSRGALSADLVEKTPRAAQIVQRNVDRVMKALRADATAHVHRVSADQFLRTPRGPFTLVFIDPPYALTDAELTATLTLLMPSLSPDAVIIIERAAKSPAPALPDSLSITRSKRYGDTMMWWASAT